MTTKRAVLERVFNNFKERAKEIVGEDKATLFPQDLAIEDLILVFPLYFTEEERFRDQLDALWASKHIDLPVLQTAQVKAAALVFISRFATLLNAL